MRYCREALDAGTTVDSSPTPGQVSDLVPILNIMQVSYSGVVEAFVH